MIFELSFSFSERKSPVETQLEFRYLVSVSGRHPCGQGEIETHRSLIFLVTLYATHNAIVNAESHSLYENLIRLLTLFNFIPNSGTETLA